MQSMSALEAISTRRSIRSYEETQISAEQLDAILNAFLEAPTAINRQEIRAIVLQDKATIDELNDSFATYNRNSGRPSRGPKFHHGAPTVVLLIGPKDFSYSEIDGGIAVENMALAAKAVGVGSVILGCLGQFFMREDSAAWRTRLGIGSDEMFVIGIALGYQTGEAKRPSVKEGRITKL